MKLFQQIRDKKFNKIYHVYDLRYGMNIRSKLEMQIYLSGLVDIYINIDYILYEVINGFDKYTRRD